MSHRVVFGFGNPPSQMLISLHQRAIFHGVKALYNYQPINIEGFYLDKCIGVLHSANVMGCHFTEPLQVNQCPWLDNFGSGSQSSGRVNIIYKDQQLLVGEDTLHSGSLRALQRSGFQPEGARVLLLGSSLEAQSIVRSLALTGISQLLILHSSVDRIRVLASGMKRDNPDLSVMIGNLQSENLQDIMERIDLMILAIDIDDPVVRAILPARLRLGEEITIIDLFASRQPFWEERDELRILTAQSLLLWQYAECFRLWNNFDLPRELLTTDEYSPS
ncbi:MAG: hypothetical protein FWE76_00525 [Symbiobacteriaceae bacterium]|nr:hypothetical protein [Symbiobacteriaceae bacterium]